MSKCVRIDDVLNLCDVIKNPPWLLSVCPMTFERLVRHCLKNQILEERPANVAESQIAKQRELYPQTPENLELFLDERLITIRDFDLVHASRVAYLVEHPDPTAICIDVGIEGVTDPFAWEIDDGNHRLYAAAVRGDDTIEAELQGSVALLEEYFGEGVCE